MSGRDEIFYTLHVMTRCYEQIVILLILFGYFPLNIV